MFQGVECLEKESELGFKPINMKQIVVPKEKSVWGTKVCVSRYTIELKQKSEGISFSNNRQSMLRNQILRQ